MSRAFSIFATSPIHSTSPTQNKSTAATFTQKLSSGLRLLSCAALLSATTGFVQAQTQAVPPAPAAPSETQAQVPQQTQVAPQAQSEVAETIRSVEDSIIKISTTSAAPDYFTPWRLMTPRQSSGSGTVISGNRILTNAHVVANASYVQAQKHNDPRKFLARVTFVSHDADLAIITVDDPGFFSDLRPLDIGNLPNPHEQVSVFGYPIGGKTLSITQGILSRVEHQTYAHSGSFLLAGQLDAAINPGNSGGPVIVDEQIVGVVMQANSGGRSENLGYFVPPDIIRHVLKDSDDGIHDGFPDLGFRTQALESPAAKAAYGLNRDQNGVLVVKVFENSPVEGVLQDNDVVLKIDGHSIADDGSVKISESLQTNYKHAIDLRHTGEEVEITFARGGEIQTAVVTARNESDNYSLVKSETFDETPEYYIYGGILFVPLNMNLIKRWGSDWNRSAPVNLLQARDQWASPERNEVVVAMQVMAADVNLGYHNWRNWIVDTVGGEPVKNFEHFAELLHNNEDEHVVFENNTGYQMVIDHQQALDSEEEILNRYRIPASYSAGLVDEDAPELSQR